MITRLTGHPGFGVKVHSPASQTATADLPLQKPLELGEPKFHGLSLDIKAVKTALIGGDRGLRPTGHDFSPTSLGSRFYTAKAIQNSTLLLFEPRNAAIKHRVGRCVNRASSRRGIDTLSAPSGILALP